MNSGGQEAQKGTIRDGDFQPEITSSQKLNSPGSTRYSQERSGITYMSRDLTSSESAKKKSNSAKENPVKGILKSKGQKKEPEIIRSIQFKPKKLLKKIERTPAIVTPEKEKKGKMKQMAMSEREKKVYLREKVHFEEK